MIVSGPNKTEIMFMIFFDMKYFVELIFLGSLEAILTYICDVSGHFMFMYRFLSIK